MLQPQPPPPSLLVGLPYLTKCSRADTVRCESRKRPRRVDLSPLTSPLRSQLDGSLMPSTVNEATVESNTGGNIAYCSPSPIHSGQGACGPTKANRKATTRLASLCVGKWELRHMKCDDYKPKCASCGSRAAAAAATSASTGMLTESDCVGANVTVGDQHLNTHTNVRLYRSSSMVPASLAPQPKGTEASAKMLALSQLDPQTR